MRKCEIRKKKKIKNPENKNMTNVFLFECPNFRHAESVTDGKSSDDFDRWIA